MPNGSKSRAERLTELNIRIHDEIARALEAGGGQVGDEDRARILALVEDFLRLEPGAISARPEGEFGAFGAAAPTLTPEVVFDQLVGAVQRETAQTQVREQAEESESQGETQLNAGLDVLRAQVQQQLPDSVAKKPLILEAIDAYGRGFGVSGSEDDFKALERMLNLLGVPFELKKLETIERDADGRPLPPKTDVGSIPLFDEFSAVIESLVTAETPEEDEPEAEFEFFRDGAWSVRTGEPGSFQFRVSKKTRKEEARDPVSGIWRPSGDVVVWRDPAIPADEKPALTTREFFDRDGKSQGDLSFYRDDDNRRIFVAADGTETRDTGLLSQVDPTLQGVAAEKEADRVARLDRAEAREIAADERARSRDVEEARRNRIAQIQAAEDDVTARKLTDLGAIAEALRTELASRDLLAGMTSSDFRNSFTSVSGGRPFPAEFESILANLGLAEDAAPPGVTPALPIAPGSAAFDAIAGQGRNLFDVVPGGAPDAAPATGTASATVTRPGFAQFPVALAEGVGSGTLSPEDADRLWGGILSLGEAMLGPGGFEDLGIDVEGQVSTMLGLVNRGILDIDEATSRINDLVGTANTIQQQRRQEERQARADDLDIRQQEFQEEREGIRKIELAQGIARGQRERATTELQRRTERQQERLAGLEREKRGARSDFISRALEGDLPPSTPGARIGGADVMSDLMRRAGLTPPAFREIGGPIAVPDFDAMFAEELERAMAETINPETGQPLTVEDLIASVPEVAPAPEEVPALEGAPVPEEV